MFIVYLILNAIVLLNCSGATFMVSLVISSLVLAITSDSSTFSGSGSSKGSSSYFDCCGCDGGDGGGCD